MLERDILPITPLCSLLSGKRYEASNPSIFFPLQHTHILNRVPSLSLSLSLFLSLLMQMEKFVD